MRKRGPTPTVCSHPGCPNFTPCPTHKREPWRNRDFRRGGTLGGAAKTKRNKRILRRYHSVCHVCGQGGATEVDHVVPVAEGGADADSNLRPIHSRPCHLRKTQEEARRARARRSRG